MQPTFRFQPAKVRRVLCRLFKDLLLLKMYVVIYLHVTMKNVTNRKLFLRTIRNIKVTTVYIQI